MVGGLLVSAILTLVVVPLLYTLLDDLREHATRVWRAARAGGALPTPDATPGAAGSLGRADRAD
jgi:hypothetical protein